MAAVTATSGCYHMRTQCTFRSKARIAGPGGGVVPAAPLWVVAGRSREGHRTPSRGDGCLHTQGDHPRPHPLDREVMRVRHPRET